MYRKIIYLIFLMSVLWLTEVPVQAWNRVAYWDSRYPSAWSGGVEVTVRDYLVLNGYTVVNADELKTWMDARIADKALSVVVFCKDIVPDTVAETMDATCTIRRYLNAGGKVVFYADIPFWNQGHADGSNTNWQAAGSTNILGFYAAGATWDSSDTVALTAAGIEWGLTETWSSVRPTIPGNVDIVLAEDLDGDASAWVKHYVTGDSYRGFVRIVDVTPGAGNEALLPDLLRVAEYIPREASNPNPAHLAVNVSVDTNLSWIRGIGVVQEEVYFGTDPCALPKVADITDLQTNPPLYNPGDPNLVASTTYYWQIVEVNGLDRYEGDIWEFTTVRGEAQPEYPFNGALINGDIVSGNISTNLEFFPGATSVEYKGYFNEDYSKVASRHPDANLGPPPYGYLKGYEYTYWVGNPGVPPITDSLVRGTKYYWTVDCKDAKGNTYYGDVWEFAIYGYYAFAPSPPNEAILVSRDVLLSWLPGFSVDDHDVYMGTNWEDVNNAEYDPFNPPPEFLETRSEPNYQCSDLPAETKLYWRVDEVVGRGPPLFIPDEFYKGNVWCFTTLPDFPLTDPNLVGWWKCDMGLGTTAFDWSGHDNHGNFVGDPQWVSGKIQGALELDGDDWANCGTPPELVLTDEVTIACWVNPTGFAVRQAFAGLDGGYTFKVHENGLLCFTTPGILDHQSALTVLAAGTWQHVAATFKAGQTGGLVFYLDGVETDRMNASAINTGAGPFRIGSNQWNENLTGLIDDVQVYDYALSGAEIRMLGTPAEAWIPSPYDGEVGVPVTTPLQWMPGRYAALHDVYLGTDKAAVESATTSTPGIYKGRIGPNSLGPLALDAAELYYWRIDEVNLAGPDPCMWEGDVWTFRTIGAAGGLLGLYYHWDGLLPNDPLGPDNAFQIFVLDRIDPQVDFPRADHYWATLNDSPDPNINVDDFGCKWVGHVECPVDANYTFSTETDDGARLFIDGQKMPLVNPAAPQNDSWRQQGPTEYGASIVLSAGLHDIEMHMYEHAGGAAARLRWSAIPTNPSDYPIFGLSTSRQIIPPIWLWPPLFASSPRPSNGATIDDRTPALEWIPGFNAVYHELYFSANFDDVNNRNPAVRQITSDPCYPYPAVPPLQLGRTYYWCVDEVKSVSERWDARTIWSFTISECLSLDNMEDYNDRGELREVWRDGNADVVWTGTYPYLTLAQGGSSGSNLNVSTAVGSPSQGATGPIPPTPLNYEAMVLRYDNDGWTYTGLPGEEKWLYDAPYYSEIEANTVGDNSLDVGQTWDSEGVKSLSVSFQGHPISDGYYDPLLWPTYTQYGRGRDIWGRHDEFFYLSKYPFIGGGSIQVQVLSVDNTDPWAKAGVMIREKWTPYSKFAAVFVTPGQGVTFNYRDVEDGPCTSITKPGVTAPQYVRLVRNIGGTFEAKHSANGFVWDDVNAPNTEPVFPEIVMGTIDDPNIYAGTAVSSHNANQMCAADFNEVLLNPLPANWIFGNIGTNDPERLYVALSDGVNTSVVEHDDANAVTLTTWQEWNIDLSDFTTVNLNGVKKVYIGLGDRADPCLGGSGAIYVDDIRACPPRCIPALAKPVYDIAQPYDCIVDEKDLALVGIDWLLHDEVITTVAPSDSNLIARYTFDTDYTDSVGGFNLDPNGSAQIVTDPVRGGVLNLDGTGYLQSDYNAVDLGIDGNTPRTFSCWAYTRQFTEAGLYEIGQHVNGQDWSLRTLASTDDLWRAQHWGYPTYDFDFSYPSKNVWVHFAHVYDGNEIKVYADGRLMGSLGVNLNTAGSPKNLSVGKWSTYAPLNGMIDDLRIYNYGLSQAEAAYIAADGAGMHQLPILSVADVYQGEAPGNQWINFKDYALIADKYLERVLWPTTP